MPPLRRIVQRNVRERRKGRREGAGRSGKKRRGTGSIRPSFLVSFITNLVPWPGPLKQWLDTRLLCLSLRYTATDTIVVQELRVHARLRDVQQQPLRSSPLLSERYRARSSANLNQNPASFPNQRYPSERPGANLRDEKAIESNRLQSTATSEEEPKL